MNVLYISRGYPPDRGGTENYTWEIYERSKLVNSNKLITIYNPGREPRSDIVQVRVDRKNKYLAFLRFWLSSMAKSAKLDVDIIHAVTYPSALCGIIPKILKKVPLVTTIHDIGVVEKEIIEIPKLTKVWKGFLQQVVCSFSDGIIVPSEKVRDDIMKYHKIKAGKIFITGYGIDRKVFNPDLEYGKIRKKLGIGKGPMLLFVGMFGPKKGLEYAIEAVSMLKKRFPEIKLVIGGPCLYENYLKKLKLGIVTLGLENNVIFGGYIDQSELPYWFRDCDIYVDPTLYGMGYCFPCVEAAAVGKPIVATKLLEEVGVVRNGFNGIVIGYRDPKQLADAISNLLSDKTKLGGFSKNSLELAGEFDWEKTVQQTNKVYEKIIGNGQ